MLTAHLLLAFLAQSPAEPGALALFDGSTLAGWRGDPRYWSVEDGAIVGRSTEAVPCTRNTFLIWQGTVADFELTLEYRIDGGNSGIQYRSRDAGDFVVEGYQADIDSGPHHAGILYEERGRGILALRGERVAIGAGGARRAEPALGEAAELQRSIHSGQWNRYRITARGGRLDHEINGVPMVEVDDADAERAARSGILALQLHSGSPMAVRFRNLRLTQFESAAAAPEWIWSARPVDPRAESGASFRRAFELPSRVESAIAEFTCDNRFIAWINGAEIARSIEWERPVRRDVARFLRPGRNVIAIAAFNEGGPAGLAGRIALRCSGEPSRTLATDATWEAADDPPQGWERDPFAAAGFAPARSLGAVAPDRGPWGDVFAPRTATPASAIQVPPGFAVELLHSAQADEGSWISLALDAHGRALIGRERGGVLRCALPAADAAAGGGDLALEDLGIDLPDPQGLLAVGDALFLNANGDAAAGAGLWRLDDRDGDGSYEARRRLFAAGPGGEHGGHGVELGPDGMLYVMQGNHTALPPELAATSPHRNYAEDLLAPREWDPNGHAVNVLAPGAHVLRLSPEGGPVELFAAGCRNPYDIAFNADGELFSFDADMEWDIGLPWYRPTRIVHFTSGAEFGWRSGSGKWPEFYCDSLPAVVDVGPGSPTGIAFAYASSFPDRYRQALFCCDWTFGRIVAVHLAEDGSSYRGEVEEFVRGRPLPVTDVAFAKDGSMVFTTGGRNTQSGLYRVRYVGAPEAAVAPAALPAAAAAARSLRRALERFHPAPDAAALAAAWAELGSSDRFVRHAARVALERQDVASWRGRAIAEPEPRAKLAALLALARAGAPADLPALAAALERTPYPSAAAAERLDELRVAAVALCRLGPPPEEVAATLRARYEPHFPTGEFLEDRELATVLLALGSPPTAERCIGLLDPARPLAEQIAFAFLARDHAGAVSPAARERLFQWLARARGWTGGHSFQGFLRSIRDDALASAPEAERGALERLADASAPEPAPAPALAAALAAGAPWTLDELLPHLDQVARGRSFDRGRAAFEQALCARCHRFAGAGGTQAPDLTSAPSRFSRRDLLQSILEPSAVVSDQYEQTEFTRRDRSLVTGRVLAESNREILVCTDLIADVRVKLQVREIASRQRSPVSSMPPNLIDRLELEQVLDLLAFLESGGDRNAPQFQR